MGEFVLVKITEEEVIPRSPSYLQVVKVYIEWREIKAVYSNDSEEATLAEARYETYRSRMDSEESGLLMMEINNFNSNSAKDDAKKI
jgi:hypothetical protein